MPETLNSLLNGAILFGDRYRNKRALVTGHTGFKGSWLCLWLEAMGATVMGYALPPDTHPCHYALLESQMGIKSVFGDIRDLNALQHAFADFQPEIVFHLAAQPLVRLSYAQPIETLETNIMGAAHVFEACRSVASVRAIINVTSDKCYENREWVWGYRENDPMGGYDPYSASKGCAELVTAAYRNSFFNPEAYSVNHHALLASARAGNVIGGGDWAKDRIVTDMMAAAAKGETLLIRNPEAIRPWQHVLEPLSGYLQLGQKLLEGKKAYAGAWNFGPGDGGAISVIQVVREMQKTWDKIEYAIEKNKKNPHEAGLLKLDCSKARAELNWKDIWSAQTSCLKTVKWYKTYYERKTIITLSQMKSYIHDAHEAGAEWICRC